MSVHRQSEGTIYVVISGPLEQLSLDHLCGDSQKHGEPLCIHGDFSANEISCNLVSYSPLVASSSQVDQLILIQTFAEMLLILTSFDVELIPSVCLLYNHNCNNCYTVVIL